MQYARQKRTIRLRFVGHSMRTQDFSKKFVIIVNRELPAWQVVNTVAHCSAYLANKMAEDFDTDEFFVTKDGKNHPRNCQYPIITLAAKPRQLLSLVENVRNSGLLYIDFFREMIETTDDSEIESVFANKNDADITYLGVGIFGEKSKVDLLTKKFSLYK